MIKTFWRSFGEGDTGRNLGICVVDVDEDRLEDALAIVERLNPGARPTDREKWALAAVGQALLLECNPGGHVQAIDVDPTQLPTDLPRNRLIQEDELRRNGWA